MRNIRKSPFAHVGANRASKENAQEDFTTASSDESFPRHITVYLKNVLVQLGANGISPNRSCTNLRRE